MNQIRVAVCGAAGKMGRSIIKGFSLAPDLKLTGAVDLSNVGEDAGVLAGIEPLGIEVNDNLADVLAAGSTDVLVDFTSPLAVMDNIHCALRHLVATVVGTTGISQESLAQIGEWVKNYQTGAIVAPNFATGAILMMKAAQLCAAYFPKVEIVEMHHEEKLDAPSGTACKTAQLIREAIGQETIAEVEREKNPGARGALISGIPVHSVRLPGLVAHQEIIFSNEGQLLTIRHDTFSRDCFIPGLLLAVRSAPENKLLIYGMEKLMGLGTK